MEAGEGLSEQGHCSVASQAWQGIHSACGATLAPPLALCMQRTLVPGKTASVHAFPSAPAHAPPPGPPPLTAGGQS